MPISFFPEKIEVNDVPLEMYNKLQEENEQLQNELKRCRQKVAHLERELKGK